MPLGVQRSTGSRRRGHGQESNGALVYGLLLIFVSGLFFVLGVWSMVIAPFIQESGNPVLDWMRNDKHYKYLVPFLIPVSLYAVIINWMGFKMFRHA